MIWTGRCLIAPVSGRIAPLLVRAGDYVNSGHAIIAIVSDQNWRLVVNLAERHLHGLKVGQPVWCYIGSDPWKIHPGKVRSIAPGVARSVNPAGILPYVDLNTDWIRLARRFPVEIDLGDLPQRERLFLGSECQHFPGEATVSASSATPDLFRQGTITALACWFAVVLAFFAHLDNPWWAAISAWVIAHPERQAVLTKGLSRVIGLGWLIGCCVAFLVEGAPVMQALVMFVVAATGTYERYRSKYGYAWTIGTVGALIVLSTSLETPGDVFHLAWYRALEILCGVFAATLVEFMFARAPNPSTAAPRRDPFGPDGRSALRSDFGTHDDIDSDAVELVESPFSYSNRGLFIRRARPRYSGNRHPRSAATFGLSRRRSIRPPGSSGRARSVFHMVDRLWERNILIRSTSS
jgi:Fusaric acid resistance protein family/HlyD family secretion protein